MEPDQDDQTLRSDLERLRAMRDDDIDLSDIPELDAEWFEKAVWHAPDGSVQMRIWVDRQTWDYFRRLREAGYLEAAEVLREHAAKRTVS